MGTVIFLGIIIVIILLVMAFYIYGYFAVVKKTPGAIALHVDGISFLSQCAKCHLVTFNNVLTVRSAESPESKLSIPFNQLTAVEYAKREDVRLQYKSGVGRAVVGGVLFGGLGAIVGAATNSPTEKVIDQSYMVLNYKDQETGEIKAISFEKKDSDDTTLQRLYNHLKTKVQPIQNMEL